MKTTLKILRILALMLALMLPGAGTVFAASITVTTTVDELNVDGDCSLREAIQAATTDTAVDACVAGSGADIITVPAGTYNLTIGDLDLRDVTINGTGAGSTIIKQTNPNFRVFEVLGTVNISRVTIQDGRAADSSIVPTHLHGSGLHNHGTVTLTNVTFTGNSVADLIPANPTSGRGGAIWNAGSMTLINVTIADNTAAVSGAGIGGNPPTLINTIVANNSPDNCSVAITAGSNNLQFPTFPQASGQPSCGNTIPVADPMLVNAISTLGVYKLQAGSPAIDTGTNTGCPPTDELGTARPIDGDATPGAVCDIGAFEYDPAPTVTINQAAGQPDPTSTSPINFEVVFSEPVSGFTGTDVDLSASTAPGTLTAVVTGGPTTYNVAVSGMTGSGTVVASIPANVAVDSGGNGNSASTSTDNTVTFVFTTPAPTCNGQTATIYVNNQGIIVGGPNNGQPYAGRLNGTAGADVMVGTNGRDEVSARGGNDVVCGGGDNDELDGGGGRDQLFGQGGNDVLRGGDGNDELDGGGGRDQLFGQGGNDVLTGEDGNDTLTGGLGADRFRGGGGTDTATDFTPAQGDTKTGVENF